MPRASGTSAALEIERDFRQDPQRLRLAHPFAGLRHLEAAGLDQVALGDGALHDLAQTEPLRPGGGGRRRQDAAEQRDARERR